MNVPLDPVVKLAWSLLVIAGGLPLLMLVDDSMSGWALSVKGRGAEVPTAVHAVGPVHETPRKRLY